MLPQLDYMVVYSEFSFKPWSSNKPRNKLPSSCSSVKSSPSSWLHHSPTQMNQELNAGFQRNMYVCMYTHDLSTHKSINTCLASNSEVWSSMYEYCKYSAKYKKPITQRCPMILLSRTTKTPDREGYMLGAMGKGGWEVTA